MNKLPSRKGMLRQAPAAEGSVLNLTLNTAWWRSVPCRLPLSVKFRTDPNRRIAGATLIEIMIASVILAVVALAGGAFVVRSRADIALQKNRRVAVELANARLEEMMYDWPFADVANMVGSPTNQFWKLNGTVPIYNEDGFRRRTIVRQTGGGHDECLRIIVRMRYNPRNTADEIRLETLRGR